MARCKFCHRMFAVDHGLKTAADASNPNMADVSAFGRLGRDGPTESDFVAFAGGAQIRDHAWQLESRRYGNAGRATRSKQDRHRQAQPQLGESLRHGEEEQGNRDGSRFSVSSSRSG